MSILTRAILRTWFSTFIVTALALVLLLTIGNLVSQLMRDVITFQQSVINFGFELPAWLNNVIPVSCMSATLFSLEKLKSKNELVAILASGHSARQIVFEVGVLSLFISGIMFVDNAFIVPSSNKARLEWIIASRAPVKVDGTTIPEFRTPTALNYRFWTKNGNTFLSYEAFDKKNQIIKGLSLYEYESGHLHRIINAQTARQKNETEWILERASVMNALNQKEFPKEQLSPQLITTLPVNMASFKLMETQIYYLNFNELLRYFRIYREANVNTDSIRLYIYTIMNSALFCTIFALLPIGTLNTPTRRQNTLGKNVAFTIVFYILFWFLNSTMITLGDNSTLIPELAIFSTSLLFISYITYRIIRL